MKQRKFTEIGLLGRFLFLFVFLGTTNTSSAVQPINKTNLQDNNEISTSSSSQNEDRFIPIFNLHDNTVKFYLFTTNNSRPTELIPYSSNSIRKSSFNPKVPTKLLIHGYRRNAFSDFPHFVKNAYLKYSTKDYNIICVDWKRLASHSLYLNSAYNTRLVGEKVGQLVIWLRNEDFVKYEDVHVIGFSLGAQVAGYVGKYVYNQRNSKIGRITGLDPAGPGFTGPDSINRLDSQDADFVDVIHTSIKSGLLKSIGHLDFFPNGGEAQPGCSFETFVDPLLGGCSHLRSVELFIESIRGTKLYGCSCSNWTLYYAKGCDCDKSSNLSLMGEFANKNGKMGTFYLKTASVPPFIFKPGTGQDYNHYKDDEVTYNRVKNVLIEKGKNGSEILSEEHKDLRWRKSS